MNWNQEQYRQLTGHYRNLPDRDLLHLAAHPEDLTAIAEEVLTQELATRNLNPAATPEAAPPEPISLELDAERAEAWNTYAAHAPAHCTFPYDETVQAYHAQNLLAESGIFSRVTERSNQPFDIRVARVVVLPEDAERAALLLAQPIPAHIVSNYDAQIEVEKEDTFTLPACPVCGAPDAMLLAVDPTNHWLCESCEHEWDDPVEEAPAQ